MTSSGEMLGQIQLPSLQRLGSYFSDNDGDAVLGQSHLFVTDGPFRRRRVESNYFQRGLEWQPPGGLARPSVSADFPCWRLGGDQLLVNETGNSDGKFDLVRAYTQTLALCPNFCERRRHRSQTVRSWRSTSAATCFRRHLNIHFQQPVSVALRAVDAIRPE